MIDVVVKGQREHDATYFSPFPLHLEARNPSTRHDAQLSGKLCPADTRIDWLSYQALSVVEFW
jgi:hypothetical protein